MSRRKASFPASRTFSPVPVHPGEHLREDFMQPLGLSVNGLALALRVPATRILAIVKQKRRISPDTALRLARYFKTSPEFWLNLQIHYELALAERESLPQLSARCFLANTSKTNNRLRRPSPANRADIGWASIMRPGEIRCCVQMLIGKRKR